MGLLSGEAPARLACCSDGTAIWIGFHPYSVRLSAIPAIRSSSAVTAWELGIKRASGRLDTEQSIEALSAQFGFTELPITMRHGQYAVSLPLFHKDPFDRTLVAQAFVEKLVPVTADRRLSEYQVAIL